MGPCKEFTSMISHFVPLMKLCTFLYMATYILQILSLWTVSPRSLGCLSYTTEDVGVLSITGMQYSTVTLADYATSNFNYAVISDE